MEEEKRDSIFRKQAMDKVSSPEELDGYLKVTRPGVWFVLIAIIVLLIGVICWAALGRLESTVKIAVISSDEQVLCLVPADSAKDIILSGKIKIADKSYDIKDAGFSAMTITSDMDQNILGTGLVTVGQSVIPMAVEGDLASGIYSGEVVTEVVKPISFIIN